MKRLRLSAALVAVLLWLPTLFGLSYGALLWNAVTGGGPAPDAAPVVAEPAMAAPDPAPPPVPHDAALVDTEALGPGRSVTVIRSLPFAAFLAAPEAPPDAAYRDLYAEARAGALAEAECARLVESLAARCRPLEVSATPEGNGDYHVTLRLAFAPQDGLPPIGTDQVFERAATPQPLDPGTAQGVSAEELAAAHATLYWSARLACLPWQMAGRACTVAELVVETRPSADPPGRFDVTGQLRLAVPRPAEGG